jgi:threonine/homoserine/homoserine lactone efflux protein
MGAAIGSVLTFAVGVAVSPVPIIAVILMLFSARARANGPAFLAGWVLALALVSGVVYVLADTGDVGTSSTATDVVAWGTLVLGVLLLVGAARRWRTRPAPGTEAPMPKWMAGIDSMAPGKAFVLGVVLAGVNPKNLALTIGAATSLAQLTPTSTEAVVALVAFVLVASLTIVVPVVYALAGGPGARAKLDGAKTWLGANNAAVMAVLLLVFGVDLVAKALAPLW